MDDAPDLPDPADEVVSPDDRVTLASQIARLNNNLERQFDLIDRQQASDRKASRRRWQIVMAVVLLIGLGNVRVEQVRREGDERDKATAAAQTRKDDAEQQAVAMAACRRTNLSRSEIREAFDQQGAALVAIAQPAQRAVAEKLVQDTHDRLAATLKSSPCTSGPAAVYHSCAEAVADGAAPLRRGQPGYRAALDGDSDGVACE